MALVARCVNESTLTGITSIYDYLVGVELTDDTGGENFTLTVTAETDEAGAFTPVLKGTDAYTILNNQISGIWIPEDTKAVTLWFLIQMRKSIIGENTNLVITLTPATEGAVDGTPDTVTIDYVNTYDPAGIKNEFHYLQGNGIIRHNEKDLGYYSEDGVVIAPTKEDSEITAGNAVSVLGSASTKRKFTVRCGLHQVTLENLKLAWGLNGAITRTTTSHLQGGTRTALRMPLTCPPPGINDTGTLQVEGFDARRDGKDIVWTFSRVTAVNPGEFGIKKSDPSVIPVEFDCYGIVDQSGSEYFGDIEIIDAD